LLTKIDYSQTDRSEYNISCRPMIDDW